MLANPKRHDQAGNPMRLPWQTNAPICVDLVHMPTFIKGCGTPPLPPPAPPSFALPSVQVLLSIICLPGSRNKQETICLIPQLLKPGPSRAI
jgi:hypothetical protein